MSKKTKLTPELRFPEFVDEGEWEEKILGKLAKIIVKKNKDGLINNVFTNSAIDGIVDQRDYFDKDIANKNNLENYYIVEDGDYVYNPRISNIAPVGPISKNKTKKRGVLSPLYTVFRFTNKNNDFYEYYFKTIHWYSAIRKASNTGARFDRMSITDSVFMNIPILYPLPSEQQKIASCLSSLDEMIAAQVQKLDLLKDHKKGLMQKLFPQEGEKVPKYRFKEFEKDGEWNLKEFSNYIKLYRGSSPRPIQNYLTQDKNGVNWIKIGDTKNAINSTIYKVEERITLKGAQKSRKVKTGELILANSMSFGKTYELAINGYIYDGWFVLREYENHYYKPFLLQLLNSDYMQRQYQKLSAGGIVQNISSEIVYKTILFHTSFREQQKIASCLSSLDALITAQTEKIEQLKLHKKGLMQGLFPKIND
ncbi:restriction endonuclease subunit S [Apibacter sp. ESL0432]|uniref:restriction endonuclease subunit S n=1 Tax=Apibacter sp. ESL0432 TaxID=2704652 RepID=UPI001C694E3F|nr:restriction endonuclease subunit S [Apibacter sp. ESL0432]QYN48986.1 restriction endonuclease subunit S [Apibacter sp. ESL0432]